MACRGRPSCEVGSLTEIVHVIGSLDRGGAESVLLDLVRGDRTAQHHVLCWSGRAGALAPLFRDSGATVDVVPPAGDVSKLRWLRTRLRALGPSALVSHVSLASAFVLAAAPRSIRTRIARVHSAGDGNESSLARRIYRGAARALLPIVATRVLAVSDAARAFAVGEAGLLYRASGCVAEVLPNGVDTDRFTPEIRRSTTGGQPPRVLHVGRAAPEKNRAMLVPIFTALQEFRPAAMEIVGSEDVSDLGALPQHPLLSVSGPRPDIEIVIANADVLVLPSLREGLPGVVLEALACGVPVVASDIPTLRELSGRLGGIAVVDLAAGPDRWARAICDALAIDVSERQRIRQRVLASEYTLTRNLEHWASRWH
ncbi:glycosyltransferase [Agrococcus lahaulensis]|nr:glycosyltransferase [Agrococcus lahaulensis]